MKTFADLSPSEIRKAAKRIIEVSMDVVRKEFDVDVTEADYNAAMRNGMLNLHNSGLIQPLRVVEEGESDIPDKATIGRSVHAPIPMPIPRAPTLTGNMLVQRFPIENKVEISTPESEPGKKWILYNSHYTDNNVIVEWREMESS